MDDERPYTFIGAPRIDPDEVREHDPVLADALERQAEQQQRIGDKIQAELVAQKGRRRRRR